MSVFDYVLIAVYFVFMLLTGVLFKRHTRDTSNYFRGGGVMTWWLIGASSFVQTFSAWSFVGLAGHRLRLAEQGRQSGDYFIVPGISYDGWKLDQ